MGKHRRITRLLLLRDSNKDTTSHKQTSLGYEKCQLKMCPFMERKRTHVCMSLGPWQIVRLGEVPLVRVRRGVPRGS